MVIAWLDFAIVLVALAFLMVAFIKVALGSRRHLSRIFWWVVVAGHPINCIAILIRMWPSP